MDAKNGETVLANSKSIPRDELRMLNALIDETGQALGLKGKLGDVTVERYWRKFWSKS